ncbi:hypothetical protein ACQ4PT_033375 [Festuca glaucescens]
MVDRYPTGGYRVCSYLDPSEPTHAKVKQMLFSLLASRKDAFILAFRTHFSSLLATVEILEEPLLHTFHLPPFLVSRDYKALYKYFLAADTNALDIAESLGLNRDEACHNLLFATVFNSYGGLKVLLPGILARLAGAGEKFHQKLATEIRATVADAGGKVMMAALEKMELTKSTVWEALRLDPPVKYQYGRAKNDLNIESHDAVFAVKKGAMLFGYQLCATKDPRVFGATAAEFVGDRGSPGRKGTSCCSTCTGPTGGSGRPRAPAWATSSARERTSSCSSAGSCSSSSSSGYDTFTAVVGTDLLGAKVELLLARRPPVLRLLKT